MEEIMQLEQVHAKLDQEVSKLEEIRGYLSYENVVRLNQLKKQKLLIKDKICNLKGF
ncbi:MAG: YdcH family protein [Bacteroidales bacterium]|nr:YdcH family protein [Bacteroidales bacterium]